MEQFRTQARKYASSKKLRHPSPRVGVNQLMVNENLNLPITFDLRNVPVERFGAVEVRCYVAGEHRTTLPLWVMQTPSA